ncbi:MAG: hypothetical protein R3327_02385 [Nitrosopumilaceae archaeon]|nr:hypothetical protein [Nitrosopumilaceae archaeon]
MKEAEFSTILVTYRFDGSKESETIPLTLEQYENLKMLPITVECKIVKNQKPTLSKNDIKIMNEKLKRVFAKSKSHTQELSK